MNTKKEEVTPDYFPSVHSDNKWTDEILKQAQQSRKYQKFAFYGASGICLLLYISFFVMLFELHSNTEMLRLYLEHKHLFGLFLSLLIVPSAILWGLLRAVFHVSTSSSQSNTSDILKTITTLHPSSGQ